MPVQHPVDGGFRYLAPNQGFKGLFDFADNQNAPMGGLLKIL
jgi:hypothetical protein